jgi:hypothetical protein
MYTYAGGARADTLSKNWASLEVFSGLLQPDPIAVEQESGSGLLTADSGSQDTPSSSAAGGRARGLFEDGNLPPDCVATAANSSGAMAGASCTG